MGELITGSHGQLGQELHRLYPGAVAIDKDDLDITNHEAVTAFDWHKVDIIFNAAAYTQVDEAERPENEGVVWAVNAEGVRNLVEVANLRGITLVHTSTDYVFDGKNSQPYKESDAPSPQSVYGKSKAEGDNAAGLAQRHYIVRTSGVVGNGPNFVRTMLKAGATRDVVEVVNDQRGRLTFAADLALAMKHLVGTEAAFGIYNFSNAGPAVSWYELTQTIYKLANIKCEVRPISTAAYAEGREYFAPRPANSVLDLTKIEATGLEIRDWHEALEEYIKGELAT